MKNCECGAAAYARGLCRRHHRAEAAARTRVNPCACGCGELVERTYKHGHWSRSPEARIVHANPERNRKISETKKGIAAGGRPRRPRQLHLYLRPTPAELAASASRTRPERPGDRKQARAKVHALIRSGRLPHPQAVPCMDCGHRWRPGDPRHEYDHHKGYGDGAHLAVDAVCQPCHLIREAERLRALRDARGEESA